MQAINISVPPPQASPDDGNIDYSTYSCASLLDARGNIQSERYPKNCANLQAEIATRPELATHVEAVNQTPTEAAPDAAIGMAIVEVALGVMSALS